MSKASRESQNDRPLLGESASPFIGEGDGLINLERERERECSLVLFPMPSGTRQFVGTHNTVDA